MTQNEAYREIEAHYRASRESLVGQLTRACGSKAEAEDTVQEAYARACQYWYSLKPGESVGGWIYGILQNCTKDTWRDSINNGMSTDLRESDIPRIDMAGEYNIQLQEVKVMISEEKASAQRILNYHLFDALTGPEIEQLVPDNRQMIWRIIREFKQRIESTYGSK